MKDNITQSILEDVNLDIQQKRRQLQAHFLSLGKSKDNSYYLARKMIDPEFHKKKNERCRKLMYEKYHKCEEIRQKKILSSLERYYNNQSQTV